jgi:hypothetical protein
MPDEPTGDTGAVATESASSFDMDSAVEQIAAELFPKSDESEEETADGPLAGAQVTPVTDTPGETPPEALAPPPARTPPKAWPKEMHEHWGKVEPAVQEYLEKREQQMVEGLGQYTEDAKYAKTLKETIAPYAAVLQQYRLEPHQAVQSLLQAHTRLTQGSMEQRQAAYHELGTNLGLTAPTSNGLQANGQALNPPDPIIEAIQREMQSMKQSLNAREQADYQAAHTRVTQEVEAFASDTKTHPYFQEVAARITELLSSGYSKSLQDAYEAAVKLDPIVSAKEMAAALQAEVKKQQENDRLNALKAKTAAGSNVKHRETNRTPTAPLGTMEDTIKEELRTIRERPLTTP